ncbi:MAG: LexA repressor [Alphaproteobacteria bacterium MarineAlpha6_Bin5]|nr:MAG: LexA repressor [Alphaproteobacteria bacterium MarineAlpha6_Bin5]|tara:strand:+ start:1582 stop:2196 length:615 start_codon:yes stop_codon:yes gene_type:complete
MLTKQQNKLFNFLKNRIKKTNVSPSFEEMKIAMGLKSKSGIQRLIDGLVERGFIEKKNNKKRAINILNNSIKKEEKDLINLPLLGTIAAGNPIEAIENTEDKIQIPLNLISPNKKNYVLKIEGDSMINKGIVDGDKAIIEYCNDANNGDIVVALINENEVTLKKLKKDKEKIYLIPENDNYKIQSFNPDEVSIQGKLKGIIRSY